MWSHWTSKNKYFIRLKQWEIYASYKFLLGLNNLDTNNYGVLTLFFPPLPIRALPATHASSNQAWIRAWNDQRRKRLLIRDCYCWPVLWGSVSKDQEPHGRIVYSFTGYFSQRPCHCWERCIVHLPWFALRGMWLVQSCSPWVSNSKAAWKPHSLHNPSNKESPDSTNLVSLWDTAAGILHNWFLQSTWIPNLNGRNMYL